jgi:hypothetical protein
MDAILAAVDGTANPNGPRWTSSSATRRSWADKLMRRELGDDYVDRLRALYADRIPGQSDLCCYWFEKARAHIAAGKCKRAGLLATQGIRGGANREVLKRIKESGDIFWAESDRPWILTARNVHVSMVYVETTIKPDRDRNADRQRRENWWRLGRSGADWKSAASGLTRTLFTPRVSKHRLFAWAIATTLPDSAVVAFARSDDYFFGILHSRFHEVWSLAQGTQLREKESGFRYTPTTCFETFPFPFAHPPCVDAAGDGDPFQFVAHLRAAHYHHGQDNVVREEPRPASAHDHRAAISAAAKELNELREKWLNPPEWTCEEIMEFPGSVGGPWDRYIDPATITDRGDFQVGTVRYPRIVPKDAECAGRLKDRTLTKLYNTRPGWLAACHAKLDAAVAAAYGWSTDLTDEQILERLLALNQAAAGAPQP